MKIFIPYNFIMSYHEDMHTNLIKCWGRHEGLRSGQFFWNYEAVDGTILALLTK